MGDVTKKVRKGTPMEAINASTDLRFEPPYGIEGDMVDAYFKGDKNWEDKKKRSDAKDYRK